MPISIFKTSQPICTCAITSWRTSGCLNVPPVRGMSSELYNWPLILAPLHCSTWYTKWRRGSCRGCSIEPNQTEDKWSQTHQPSWERYGNCLWNMWLRVSVKLPQANTWTQTSSGTILLHYMIKRLEECSSSGKSYQEVAFCWVGGQQEQFGYIHPATRSWNTRN